MAAIGMGSQLVYRAKEAAMRAATARLLGITKPDMVSTGITSVAGTRPAGVGSGGLPGGGIVSAQPPQPATTDVDPNEKAYKEVESFLSGIGPDGRPRAGQAGPVTRV